MRHKKKLSTQWQIIKRGNENESNQEAELNETSLHFSFRKP